MNLDQSPFVQPQCVYHLLVLNDYRHNIGKTITRHNATNSSKTYTLFQTDNRIFILLKLVGIL